MIEHRTDFVDERVHRPADSIPLEQHEFRIMVSTALVTAHDMTELIDIATTGRQQSLHCILGRGVQEALSFAAADCCAIEMDVGDGVVDEHGRVDFGQAAGFKEFTRCTEQPAA